MKKGMQSDPAYTALIEARLRKYWETGLSTPGGIAIFTIDRDALKRQLYIWRRKARDSGNTSFDHLKITHGPEKDSQELWILIGEPPK
jgi:hypothetical protein